MRLDKWLWVARFFKTRTTAVDAIDASHISVNGERAKPAKMLKAGDRVILSDMAAQDQFARVRLN